jgi:hypothetical protein
MSNKVIDGIGQNTATLARCPDCGQLYSMPDVPFGDIKCSNCGGTTYLQRKNLLQDEAAIAYARTAGALLSLYIKHDPKAARYDLTPDEAEEILANNKPRGEIIWIVRKEEGGA